MTSVATFPASVARAPASGTGPGPFLSLPDSIDRLTAYFAFARELLRTEAAWMAGVPYWDAKLKLGEHVLADAHHAEALLRRLHELKATSAEHRAIAGLEEFVRDLASAGHGDEWLDGLYGEIKPWFIRQLETYLGQSDPIMDAPSQQVLQRMVADLRRQVAWFQDYTPQFSPREQPDTREWCGYLGRKLAAITLGLDPLDATSGSPPRPGRRADFAGVAAVRRDATFHVVDRREFPEGESYEEVRFLVFYNHTQEMQFAESLGAILYETAAMPWAFHFDLARHLADEVRHAGMGQARLEQLGIALAEVPMMTQHYAFRSHLGPVERFCLMTLVMEASSFERKRANVALFTQQEDAVSALYETYDIRDEMLHTHLGHVWVPILLRVYHDARSVSELVEHCRGLIGSIPAEYPASVTKTLAG